MCIRDSENGNYIGSIHYTYDGDGERTQINYYDADGSLTEEEYYEKGILQYYREQNDAGEVAYYNADGTPR